MNKKKICTCIIISILSLNIIGCDSNTSLFSIVFGEGSDEMIGTMSVGEYDLKIDRLLTTIFNDAETHLANSKYVISGTRTIDEEYTLVQTSINNVQEVIDEIDKIAEPSSKTTSKASLLVALTNYKNSLMEYAIALQNENMEDISTTASNIMSNMETLKGEWQTYTE